METPHVGPHPGSYDPDVRPTAIVTVADLTDIELSGASRLTAPSDTDGSVETSGASNVERS